MNAAGVARVQVVSCGEWMSSSFQSILDGAGYEVFRASTAREALRVASEIGGPDLVLTDLRVVDVSPEELISVLRGSPVIRASTPFITFTTRFIGRKERIRYTRLGAWAVLSPPFDPEEILHRTAVFVAAKKETDRALEGGHRDLQTGLYNRRGLMRRVGEVAAYAARSGRSFACVVVGPEEEAPADAAPDVARVLTETTRLSDVRGRISGSEFAIVAPGIDASGGRRLAERVFEASESRAVAPGERDEPIRLRAGVFALPEGEPRRAGPSAERILSQAVTALRRARADGEHQRVHAVEGEID